MEELVEIITCRQCGQQKPASARTPHWCKDCEDVYNNRLSYARYHNEGWMDVAKDSGLELYERQPGETQLEWTIWQAYRDSYPGAKPNYRTVAEKVGSTYRYVAQTAQRWDFQVRMQAWIAECDRVTLAQRRQEVLDMNAEHIAMAAKLRDKLNQAIDLIQPSELKPGELNNLLKTVTELEKKARLDTVEQDAKRRELIAAVDGENSDVKVSQTKTSELGEVLNILLSAGALGDITQIGVRQVKTETTEVVMKDGSYE